MRLPANFSIFFWYCLLNTATTILPILQDNHHPHARPSTTFYHPLMQTEIMIVAEMLCMFAYLFSKEEKRDRGKPRVPILVCLVPLALDLSASTLEMIALNFLSGSVFSITSSIVIISTAFFTKVLLRKTFKRTQIAGCLFAIAGVFLTGFAEYTQGTSDTPKDLFLLGLILTLIAYVIEGLEMVVIEIIHTKYDVTPNEFVGIMGTAGTVFWTCVVVAVSYLGCPMKEDQCVQDYQGGYHLEHFPSYFRDVITDPFLITMGIINLLAIARFNYDVNRLIAVANAMVYQVVNIFCNLFIWAVGITITLFGSGDEEFQIESLGTEVILIKMAGFALATIGLLLYNQVIFREGDETGEVQPLVVKDQWKDVESGGQVESSGRAYDQD